MSLPSIIDVRNRIEAIEDLGIKRCYQTIYLLGLRVGEACGYKYDSETKAQPTGMHLSVRRETFKPNLLNFDEVNDLRAVFTMNNGHVPTEEEIGQIMESVAIFHIVTEKRKGSERNVALPLNPNYEGWTQQITDYILQRQNKTEPVFPYYRQELWPIARRIFGGLTYPIVAYKRARKDVQGNVVKNENGKVEYEVVSAHQKNFADHALRHLRATELKSYYRIKGEMLDAFMGWAKPRGGESSAMQDRYVLEPWREAGYFPRLLRHRI